jgi:hypothetical protein
MSARAGRTAHGPTSPTRPDSLSSSPPLAHATRQARRRASHGSTDLDTPAASPPRVSSATAPTVSCTACRPSVRGPDAAGSARAGSAEAAFRRVFHFCQSRRARGEIMASGLTVSMSCARAKAVAPAPASVLKRALSMWDRRASREDKQRRDAPKWIGVLRVVQNCFGELDGVPDACNARGYP